MKYFEAESMRQKMNVALEFKDLFPEWHIDVAKKYTADQWIECGEALLGKIEEQREDVLTLLKLVVLARRAE